MSYNFRKQVPFPDNFWEWLVSLDGFEERLQTCGFYEFDDWSEIFKMFKAWHSKRNSRYVSGIRPSFSSADHYSASPKILRRNELFYVPTGKNTCVIFDGKVFPKPFLELNGLWMNAIELPTAIDSLQQCVLPPFDNQWNESSFLEALHFSGAFRSLVKEVCNVDGYHRWPSGSIKSHFPFWMKSTKQENLIPFTYDGMVDLDACLSPHGTNIVMPIEAKLDDYIYLDLAWHKLAFPSYRFIEQVSPFRIGNGVLSNLKIVPVYCAFSAYSSRKTAYIYVFPELQMYQGYVGYNPKKSNGVILNDNQQFIPKKVFEVKLS